MNLKTIKVLLFTLLALTLASFLIGCGVSKPVYFLFTALFAIGYAAVWLLCWRCPFCGRRLGRSGSGGNLSGLLGRDGRGQRCCRNARGSLEILLLAVCILDIADFRHGQDVSRAVGIGETLVTNGLGGYLRHFRFDLRGVSLDYQVLGCDSQYAAKRCQQQQDRFFHHCRKCI